MEKSPEVEEPEPSGPAGGLVSWTAGGGVEWVLVGGAVVRSQEDIKSTLVQRLEDATNVTVVARSGRRAMITKPCLGWISLQSDDGDRVFARPTDSQTNEAAQAPNELKEVVPHKRVTNQSEWPVAIEPNQTPARVYPQLPEPGTDDDVTDERSRAPNVRFIPVLKANEEATIYTVCAPHIACRKEKGLESPLVMQVKQGSEVHVVEVDGRRVRITKPCQGWISSHHKNGSTPFIMLPGSETERPEVILYIAVAEPFMPARMGRMTTTKVVRRVKPGEVLKVVEVVGRRARTINPDGWISLKTEAGKSLVKLKDEYDEIKRKFPDDWQTRVWSKNAQKPKDDNAKVAASENRAKADKFEDVAISTPSENRIAELTAALHKAVDRINKLETAATGYHTVMMENYDRIQKLENVVGEQKETIAMVRRSITIEREQKKLQSECAPDSHTTLAKDAELPEVTQAQKEVTQAQEQDAASADWQLIVDATPVEVAAKKSEPEANPFSHNPFAVFTPPSSERPDDAQEESVQTKETENEPPDADIPTMQET